jgi:hypothetical protein
MTNPALATRRRRHGWGMSSRICSGISFVPIRKLSFCTEAREFETAANIARIKTFREDGVCHLQVLNQKIKQHYTRHDLGNLILSALLSGGKNIDNLSPEDLAPIDEFHVRGRKATLELTNAARLDPSKRVLDVGSGIGGRHAASPESSDAGSRALTLPMSIVVSPRYWPSALAYLVWLLTSKVMRSISRFPMRASMLSGLSTPQ